jgi:hypothetical protein
VRGRGHRGPALGGEQPSATSACPKTTWAWVEVSSLETRLATHLLGTRSMMPKAQRRASAEVRHVQSQVRLGSQTSQSGQGVRLAGALGPGFGRTRPLAARTRRKVEGGTQSLPMYERRWAELAVAAVHCSPGLGQLQDASAWCGSVTRTSIHVKPGAA